MSIFRRNSSRQFVVAVATGWLFLLSLPSWSGNAFSSRPQRLPTVSVATKSSSLLSAVSSQEEEDHQQGHDIKGNANVINQKNHDTSTTTSSTRNNNRRRHLQHLLITSMIATATVTGNNISPPAFAEDTPMREEQRKYIQESYEDFTKTSEGWLYRDVKPGSGERAKVGEYVFCCCFVSLCFEFLLKVKSFLVGFVPRLFSLLVFFFLFCIIAA